MVITRWGRPVARLVPIQGGHPVFGVDEGRFVVPDDFDEPVHEDLWCVRSRDATRLMQQNRHDSLGDPSQREGSLRYVPPSVS